MKVESSVKGAARNSAAVSGERAKHPARTEVPLKSSDLEEDCCFLVVLVWRNRRKRYALKLVDAHDIQQRLCTFVRSMRITWSSEASASQIIQTAVVRAA